MRFFIRLALRKTTRKRWNLSHIIAGFIFFNYDMQFYLYMLLSDK